MKTIIEVPKSGCLKTKKEESAMKNKTTSQSDRYSIKNPEQITGILNEYYPDLLTKTQVKN